ncbi:hypothetical protein [Bradyrhizobium sp. URHD0069]|uniref:hypothetical protein n=1 Tax=Bradyrhizobium sp. URHD0069 TaxID=1380355 RepID=UPI0004967CE8|nr:hypothetical protein [Bradyrhizobium sp. URHD0069]
MTNADEEFLRQMTDISNRHQQAMQGMSEREAGTYVKRTIDAATIVVGIFADAGSPNGVGMHVIKGSRELQVVIASGQPDQFLIDAIPCMELEQAIAAERVWGDGQVKSDG